jgi:hypothetical protein
MLVAIRAGYAMLLVVVVTFYAGELLFRARAARLDGVLDAAPVPTWVPLAAKLLTLSAACVAFIAAGMAALMAFQLSRGHTRLEPLLYAQGLVVETLPFLLSAVLAVFLQVVLDRKWLGFLAMGLYLASHGVLTGLHLDHLLYRYGSLPSAPYSDMNGWGHFAAPVLWFGLYWSCAAGALYCLAALFMVRGARPGWRARWREARARFVAPWPTALGLCLAAGAASGAFIFYNTNVLNEYLPADEAVRRQAEYEKAYRGHRGEPQPRIASIRTEVDVFPEERRVAIRGTYRLVNRGERPISTLHVGVPPRLAVRRLELPPHRVVRDDRRLGHAVYELAEPLRPGQEATLTFEVALENPGFAIGSVDSSVAANGTFLNSRIFPSIGYLDHRELRDPAERRRQGLPPVVRMAAIDDPAGLGRNDLAHDADLVDFEATLSTSADQLALAPGDLEREWTEGGRRFFRYRMAFPIPKFFAVLSGRYAVRRDAWQGVAIEVFHHPTHLYNLDRMVAAVKETLAYMTESFTPYPHRHVRIVEFPRYGRFAAAFPGTIPFSESIGFIARLADPEAIDYPFYVTAHEVAHQWWGYEVLAADVQGSGMLSESMAQYSALMVMEREYGPEKMRRFLRYELDRYLAGRGGELLEELPLALVEDQPYVHYSKGSLALYALQDRIGEARLNAALRRYIEAVRRRAPPYTTSRELLSYLAEATPGEDRGFLHDLFEDIVLFDNRALEATARRQEDGRYAVALRVRVRKLRADGKGVETEVPADDRIDVAVFGEGGRPLYLEKRRLTGGEAVVQAVVDERPRRAGLDPWNKLVDRDPDDNVRAVDGP